MSESEVVKIGLDEVTPSPAMILSGQSIPEERLSDERTAGLAQEAVISFRRLAAPQGIIAEVDADAFQKIYVGAGMNETPAPVDEIARHAGSFSLFAVTVGHAVGDEISRRFGVNDFASGAMLDAAASVGADLAAEAVQQYCEKEMRDSGSLDSSIEVLRFSPGYCGWHVSGQGRLFDRLKPTQIGLSLSDSFLMQPLKSVSGVVMTGPLDIFDIDDTYSFCAACESHSCRDRFEALKNKRPA